MLGVAIIDNEVCNINEKSKTRITSSLLKPIKEYIKDLDKILEVSTQLRNKHLKSGRIDLKIQLMKLNFRRNIDS